MNPTPLDEHAGAHLDAIRQSYDNVAADYARFVKDPGALDPVSRAVLSAFAELVVSSGLGPTADVGCGPGKVTAYLTELGVPAFGVDLSPRMIELGTDAAGAGDGCEEAGGWLPGPEVRRRQRAVDVPGYAAARSPTGRLRRPTSVREGGVHTPSGG